MAQVKERLITNMARHLYEKLLEDTSLAVPHDNDVQNTLWRDSFLQQKVVEPLKHHMEESEIIKKFNEVFNAVAQDVSKRHGATLYSLQNTDDKGFYNTDAGFVEEEIKDEPVRPANWATMSAIVADSVDYEDSFDPGCGELTTKEKEYLTEMCRVFNDDRSAVQKTYQHFQRHGTSKRLESLYNESLMDFFDPNDGYSLTRSERESIDKYMTKGLSHKQAVYKTYKEKNENSSDELREMAQRYNDEESCEESEENECWTVHMYGWNPDEELYCDPIEKHYLSTREEAESVARTSKEQSEVVSPNGKVVAAFNGEGKKMRVKSVLRDERDMRLDSFDEDEESWDFEYLPIPEWAINYFVNGVEDSLTDEDLEEIHRFEMEYRVEAPENDAEPYFSRYPAFGLAGTVIDCPCFPVKKNEDNEELFSGPPSYGYY